ncbi:efflux RND transporter permease subunit [Aestuariirhabdus sp. Z084]|uniref:efflux RND transporter permease subunit n=1 Tax=Aestuariirhabdus haliotis TaxID=2918751 RepID=UPI00201B4570|nr:efflux RND transporter permease subunit [Aestuariirhabdus haliotis]MCL6416916.1 efflux RND transporter permease subunit [Aestuariirhabdus haliotis]MCL6420922.1 efflux RND transporter permease subunit [Aestuariirhabdus haliotis]
MKWLTDWFLDNPVAANLLMVLVLAAGVLSLNNLRVESFPQTPPSRLLISVDYPGGTPQQLDDSITRRIEQAISAVPGIQRVISQSMHGRAEVSVVKTSDTNLDRLLEDIRNRVNSIEGFPPQAEPAKIRRDEFSNLAAFVLVAGDLDADLLQRSAARVEQALKKHPDISQVTNFGKRQQVLLIEPDPLELKRYGLSIRQLQQILQSWSLEYRSGELKTAQGTLLLRGDGHADDLQQLKQLPMVTGQHGNVLLQEVARISRGFDNDDSVVRFQGQPAIALMISTSARDHLFRVSEAIEDTLQNLAPQLPADIKLDVMADMTPYIKEQLSLLSTNAWQGLLIVLVLLGLFLDLRLAFWVALGIPISIAGALSLMDLPQFNYSINDITLFGMILALGILVDDAVVVGESIHETRQRHSDPKTAARIGVDRVSIATLFGTLTTIAAFSPMLWINNELAKVLAGFSAVVIFALIFSTIESKFILPSHLSFARRTPSRQGILGVFNRLQAFLNRGLEGFGRSCYQPMLRAALDHRWAVLILFLSVFLLAYGALATGQIRSAFFPEIPGRYLTATVVMHNDAPQALSLENAQRLETAIHQASTALQQEYQLEQPPVQRLINAVIYAQEIEITAELSSEALRHLPTGALVNRWREQAMPLEGTYAVTFSASDELAGGTTIAVAARDRELARQASQALQDKLRLLPGVQDVSDDSKGGQRQLQLRVNERGRQLGVSKQDLAILVGGAFGGLEVNRLLVDGEDTRLIIRLADEQRRSLEQLWSTPVALGNSYVPLSDIVEVSSSHEPQILHRRNRDRVVNIHWRQDRSILSPEAVWARLQQESVVDIEQQFPGVSIQAVGEFEEISEVRSGFRKAMILTLMMIFVLLAIPLSSYWQPLVVISVVPFGFAGAIIGHGVLGLPVSILSLFGMMAMTGVVINDSLVLITRFNQLLAEGLPMPAALIAAGRSRLRAIFLTTVTTVCGLLPLLLETSEQAQYLKPAAVSLVFGELFATPITLLLIPLLLSLGLYKAPSANSAPCYDSRILPVATQQESS